MRSLIPLKIQIWILITFFTQQLPLMWTQVKKRVKRLPAILRNPYFIAGTLFLSWMLFLDENNLINQYRKYKELSSLEEKKRYYAEQTQQTEKELGELTSSKETQEKFAREHYWMKRDSEDVYVIVNASEEH
ncbi:MAG: septum formation initiator family protein [Chitinophagales bacterium]